MHKHHPDSPNGLDDLPCNDSGNTPLEALLETHLNRRAALKGALAGGLGLALGGFLGRAAAATASPSSAAPFRLGFAAVAKHTEDRLALPPGYTARVLLRTGDPLVNGVAEYANDGSDDAAGFLWRAGDHHDGMHYFGLNAAGDGPAPADTARGLLAINHENITQVFLHPQAEPANTPRDPARIDKEVNAHGVSIVAVEQGRNGYAIRRDAPLNRRITAATPMEMSGPARGDDLLATRYSPEGTRTRGALNNCANGYTPWGTYLTCEENWAGYFKSPAPASLPGREGIALARYHGGKARPGTYAWANPAGGDQSGDDRYRRWDLTPGVAPDQDYRNASRSMGWVVEIDPYNPRALPRKRTALGRFAHEGAMPAPPVAGQPLVYYMGDDARSEYLYKFVSRQPWNPADARLGSLAVGDKYLDDGRLYVARFQADGSGEWVELSLAHPAIAGYKTYAFADQADVLIHARLAADAVGATPMDRPEWTGVHPVTGDVYLTLTNHSKRGQSGGPAPDAANPRAYDDGEGYKGNPNGHILRLHEQGGLPAATAFRWDVYLFGAEQDQAGEADINLSGLDADNDFSSPDGLWFSQVVPGLMWLQTDDGAHTDVSNCMMLAALPGRVGDGGPLPAAGRHVATQVGARATPATLRRFLVGPRGCEITGICESPDGRALFINIQHPGERTAAADLAQPERYQSAWPGRPGQDRPRSATVVITKDDGGLIGS